MTQPTDISKSDECLLGNTGQLKHDVVIIIIILHIKHLSLFLFVGKIGAQAQLTPSPSFLIGFSRRISCRHWRIQKQICFPTRTDCLKLSVLQPTVIQGQTRAAWKPFSNPASCLFSRTFCIFLPSLLCSHIPMQHGA